MTVKITNCQPVAAKKPEQRKRKSFFQFRKSESGTVAIEFAVVGLPFFLIIFAITEIGLSYFADRLLSHSTDVIARQVRTGEIKPGQLTPEEFRDRMCQQGAMFLFKCSGVHIDVRNIPNFNVPNIPRDEDGNFDPNGVGLNLGGRSTIHIVRVYYEWPAFLNWADLGGGIQGWSGNKRLLVSTSAFMSEPF